MSVSILIGDCRERMAELDADSIDSCVTDPPYHLTSGNLHYDWRPSENRTRHEGRKPSKGFMGQTWDGGDVAFQAETWAAVMRVLKPGAHLVAFSGTRTYHRMVCAIEDAGFEIRDQLAWVYGSGFPKSLDVSKAIDKAAGAEREILGPGKWAHVKAGGSASKHSVGLNATPGYDATAPATDAACEWQGWGTALKPSWEPICLARKPLGEAGFSVIKAVETGLREQGVTGEIHWKDELASDAGLSKTTAPSSSIAPQPPAGGTSAGTAGASETPKQGPQTDLNTAAAGKSGLSVTQDEPRKMPGPVTGDCGSKSSPPTEASAPAVAKRHSASSPSTTSTAGEQRTGSPSTARSMRSSGAKVSRPAIESFAGIATGLSGSLARVLILRDSDGQFVWPEGLPTYQAGRPLTVAANVQAHGTGAINIDGCRVEAEYNDSEPWAYKGDNGVAMGAASERLRKSGGGATSPQGRWPANIIHDGSDEVLAGFPETAPSPSGLITQGGDHFSIGSKAKTRGTKFQGHGDEGSAARFFYCAKSSSEERGEGNNHPTVKPIDLMRWLCRLVTPAGGTVLDPFAGSGSTLVAADAEQFHAIGCELSPDYAAIAERRVRDAAGMFAEVRAA